MTKSSHSQTTKLKRNNTKKASKALKVSKTTKKRKGSGIIFTSIRKNKNTNDENVGKLVFLLGKENEFCYNGGNNKYDAFSGGTDNDETFLETATREASEELFGFFGSKKDIEKMITSSKEFYIDSPTGEYRTYIVPIKYDEKLPIYFNNQQKLIKKYFPKNLRKTSKILEKQEIKWFSVNDFKNPKIQRQLRKHFRKSIHNILKLKKEIKNFTRRCIHNRKRT